MPGWGLPAATGPRAAGCKRQALGERANTKTEQPLTDTRRRSRLPIHNHTHMRRHTRASRRPRLHAPHIPPPDATRARPCGLSFGFYTYIHTYHSCHTRSRRSTLVSRAHTARLQHTTKCPEHGHECGRQLPRRAAAAQQTRATRALIPPPARARRRRRARREG